jgi:hypothetical protein
MVQHVVPHSGLGLKFTAITDQDCPNLVALMSRICAPRRPLPVTTTAYSSLDL